MISKTSFSLFFVFSLLIPCSSAIAQLSQLEFDEPSRQVGLKELKKKKRLEAALETLVAKEHSEVKAARARLSEPKPVSGEQADSVKKSTSTEIESKKEVAKRIEKPKLKETFRRDVRFGKEKTELQHLTPRLKGPFIDKGESSKITSKYAWKKSGKTCGLPKDRGDALNKANAIKEILFRFGGGHAAHDALVEEYCAVGCAATQTARLTGLALDSAKGGEFRIVSAGNSCAYQLSKDVEGSWKKLDVSKIVCGCFN